MNQLRRMVSEVLNRQMITSKTQNVHTHALTTLFEQGQFVLAKRDGYKLSRESERVFKGMVSALQVKYDHDLAGRIPFETSAGIIDFFNSATRTKKLCKILLRLKLSPSDVAPTVVGMLCSSNLRAVRCWMETTRYICCSRIINRCRSCCNLNHCISVENATGRYRSC